MKKINYLLIAVFSLALFSCIEEDEELVNPPSKAETVLVRFINLAGDKEARSLVYENMYETPEIAYASGTEAVNPPADSSFLDVKKNGAIEYETSTIIKYIRNSVYTFLALPSKKGADEYRDVDTVLYFRTTAAVDKYSTNAYVKFFNAVNDSAMTYSLKVGCPNGTPIKNGARYLERMSQPETVRSGTVAFSLIKNSNPIEIINLYEVELKPRKQYLFVVIEDNADEPNLLVIEEESVEKEAVFFAKVIEERNTNIRAINYTDNNVDIKRKNSLTLFEDLVDNYIADYLEIEVCNVSDKDTIETYVNDDLKAINSLSLEVLENYTVMTFDTDSSTGYFNVITEPLRLDEDISGKALIRTINGAKEFPGLTVSIGARSDTASTGFTSGEYLANKLPFGEKTDPEIVEPGVLPIAVFTATAPAYLLFTTKVDVEEDKSYLLVLSNSDETKVNVSLIEESESGKNLVFKESAVFSQVVNALYDKDTLSVQINPPMLDNGLLASSGSLATVLDEGNQSILLNGQTINVNAESEKRVLVVAYGRTEQPEIFVINSEPMGADNKSFFWRFVNVSNINEVGVKTSEEDEVNLVNILQNSVTPPRAEDKEKKRTLYFYDNQTGEELYRLSDIQLNFGKNYTVIFTGNSPETYNIIIQQEF